MLPVTNEKQNKSILLLTKLIQMMKKLFLLLSLVIMTISASAVPAKRGLWKSVTLADGTEVRVQLIGDEHGHFWQAADGSAYRKADNGDFYVEVNVQQTIAKAKARRAKVNAKRVAKREFGHSGSFLGEKKAIMILANFTDTKFKASNDNALYQKIANEENFSEGKFKGSMADYFKAQSRGNFVLDFDIVGPVTVSHPYAYYGKNDEDENDMRPTELIIEAVNLAKQQVPDWTQYDWDGDGYVDQVYVVYAGKGEADGGNENTIWPHAWTLSEGVEYGYGSGPVTVGTGLVVDSYACGGELDGMTGQIGGIGTMCHEYSHCLGYPDFYDIDYSGGQGMLSWDLMDMGSYNGDGYQPAGYTSYERWFAGWEEPVVLEDEDVTVEDMKPLQNGGESYIIYNKRNRNEYFLLENRQYAGWDESLDAAGLLILHVDYNASVWENNGPNDNPNHQRMTWVPASKKYQYQSYRGEKEFYISEKDVFPYGNNNSFNKDFGTMAKLYNKNSNDTYYLSSSVEQITQNADGTISFNFVANYDGSDPDEPYIKPTVEGALFYESFDQCDGKGGNDGDWSGQIANGEFLTDNAGWTAEKAYGASQCAKFGTASVNGEATTPDILLNGETTMTFRAGAWNQKNDGVTLNLTATGGIVTPASVTMQRGEFTDYEVTVTGTGDLRVTFATEKGRFFLDEVVVMDPNATAIKDITVNTRRNGNCIYTIDGRYVGTDITTLRPGLYIVGGKKVVRGF